MFRRITIFLALLMMAGCAPFQPPDRAAAPLALPAHYALYTADEPGPGRWWQAFASPELDRLVEGALAGNFDVRTAWARLKQAEATARQAGAALKPSVDYSAGAEKRWVQTRPKGGATENTQDKTWSAGVTAAYEVDLWGRLEAGRRSAVLAFQAAREDLEAAAVSVAAEVATAWVEVLAVRHQIAILAHQIRANEELLNLQRLRFVNGQASALDVSEQRQALAAAKAILPTLQLAEQQQLNVLAVLLGRAGAQDLDITQQDLPEPIAVPAAGLPADLLASRPDVRAAGLRLRSADWQVSAARAERLPGLSLSADAAFSTGTLDLLLDNWVATLAASLTGPIFDAGSRKAEVDRTRAEAEGLLAEYARTVAEAIREVEDSLVTEKRQREYIALLQEQLDATRLTMTDARIQYINGQGNYLDYLAAWTGVQDLERRLIDEQATLIKNRVTLYRTIGGDWTRHLVFGATPGTRAPAAGGVATAG